MLEKLLEQVDELWGPTQSQTYRFTLGKIYNQWRFDVVSNWQKWLDKRLETHFHGATPIESVKKFLAYVKKNKIDVRSLMDD